MAVEGGGDLVAALSAGYASVAAWAEVLDRINVFPIADGDTGRNLVVSLAPLQGRAVDGTSLPRRLLLSARGNSGNIACAFLRALVEAPSDESLAARCVRGAAQARQAVAIPEPGTMLTVLDALATSAQAGLSSEKIDRLVENLTRVVSETVSAQESLRMANVVDSGALGMLVFLDGMLREYFGLSKTGTDLANQFRSLVTFQRKLTIGSQETGFCVDAVLRIPGERRFQDSDLAHLGSEVVILREGDLWKIHLHAPDVSTAKAALGQLGEVVGWSWDDLHEQISAQPAKVTSGDVHVMTDGAASLSRRHAEALGITLLDSHVDLEDRSLPETRLDPEDLYRAMRSGARVSTAQASTLERHRHYERVCSQWKNVLYLCVGSVYTGNHAVALNWQRVHPAGTRLQVIDSGAASGRLAVVARAVALAARAGQSITVLADFAQDMLAQAEEYIFLERLEYLARGGRMSKTGAFFGDALRLTPVVSPMPDGARKVAMFRKEGDKLTFVRDRITQALAKTAGRGFLLAQYTDNRAWVEVQLLPYLRETAPNATIELGPLSLTTGVHTGPGTWAVAILPE
jgi:DegV family protein with EDD domain